MTDKYHMSDKEKDEIAQSMGFGSWDEYINLDTSRIPEPRLLANRVDYSKVPDLNLSEEERDRMSLIRSHGGLISGQITYELGVGIHGLTPEEKVKSCRKGNEAQGNHFWSLEEKLDIHNFREESIGKGQRKNCPSWDYTTSKMNEKYGRDWSTNQVRGAYENNKHLLSDEEE